MNSPTIKYHSRGRPIIQVECYDVSNPKYPSHIVYEGYVTKRTRDYVSVSVPTSSHPIKHFSLIDDGNGYGHDLSNRSKERGWRIMLDQFDVDKVPLVDEDSSDE